MHEPSEYPRAAFDRWISGCRPVEPVLAGIDRFLIAPTTVGFAQGRCPRYHRIHASGHTSFIRATLFPGLPQPFWFR